MASDLTWTCVGQDSFLIKLVVYRDCNGDFLTSTPIIASCFQTGKEITRLLANSGTAVDVTPVCNTDCSRCQSLNCSFPYGIHRYTMQAILNLNNAGSCCKIKIEWQQCCRATTTTISGNQNYYTEAVLNRCLSECDNSPDFCNPPFSILCPEQFFTTCGGNDMDFSGSGYLFDSLVYEWTAPLIADSTPITYLPPYSFDKPLFFYGFPNSSLLYPAGFHIERNSGVIQFKPGKNGTAQFVEKVTEYRDGQNIGEIRHEFYVIVINCPANNPPLVTTKNGIRSKTVCANDTVSFDFFTNDPDAYDTISISWNGSLPDAEWLHTNGKAKHPTGRIIWFPNDAHASSLPYTFTVTAKDNACPIRASFTQSYQITVNPRPQANIIVTDSCPKCHTFWFLAQRIQGLGPSYVWKGENFNFTPNIGSLVWHKFSQPGIYPYTMTMTAGGCSKTYYDTVKIDTFSAINDHIPQSSLFKIYPNPASDNINIFYSGLSKWEGRLSLYDPNSKLMISKPVRFNQSIKSLALPLNGYQPGLYLLKLENQTKTISLKLLVQ